MAHISSRGKSFHVQINKRGVRVSRTFSTKISANQWAADTESEILEGKKINMIPDMTFGELLKHYAKEVSPTKRGEKWEIIRLTMMQRDPLSKVKLEYLDETDIAKWRDRRLKCVSAGSVLREWNLLSSACSIAVKEWKWLDKHPMTNVRRPKAPRARDRRVQPWEEKKLLHMLGYSNDAILKTQTSRVGAALLFAIETGMRLGEILGLTWGSVDLSGQVARLDQTKTGARREVSLSREAIRILGQLKNGSETHNIFNVSSSNFDALFRKAKGKSAIKDLHFHDTRHEAITRLAKKLTVLELARMVGHRNINQLLVYYNETAGELAKKLG